MDVDLARATQLPALAVVPDPDAASTEMLAGWKRQQLSRNVQQGTIRKHQQDVLRFVDLSGHPVGVGASATRTRPSLLRAR